ncbi:hypothetical protein Tdes44962_MAKER06103 [Teratosphaeria destructans]|uniref:Uncharacterized protein n=1 Tax=Teratosphaeria destructans TaxID=418781 RepID=A0A9W7SIR2_9PEZI|nr:hypothetical protein Tdes44962_MAKER06103 [Teratosphaeria destructans]
MLTAEYFGQGDSVTPEPDVQPDETVTTVEGAPEQELPRVELNQMAPEPTRSSAEDQQETTDGQSTDDIREKASHPSSTDPTAEEGDEDDDVDAMAEASAQAAIAKVPLNLGDLEGWSVGKFQEELRIPRGIEQHELLGMQAEYLARKKEARRTRLRQKIQGMEALRRKKLKRRQTEEGMRLVPKENDGETTEESDVAESDIDSEVKEFLAEPDENG